MCSNYFTAVSVVIRMKKKKKDITVIGCVQTVDCWCRSGRKFMTSLLQEESWAIVSVCFCVGHANIAGDPPPHPTPPALRHQFNRLI